MIKVDIDLHNSSNFRFFLIISFNNHDVNIMGRHTVLDKHFLPEMNLFSLHMDITVRSLFIVRVLKKEQSTVLAVFGRKRYDIFTTS